MDVRRTMLRAGTFLTIVGLAWGMGALAFTKMILVAPHGILVVGLGLIVIAVKERFDRIAALFFLLVGVGFLILSFLD